MKAYQMTTLPVDEIAETILRAKRLERVVRKLYEARVAATLAKENMIALASKIGVCKRLSDPHEGNVPCYQSNLLKDKWCDICKQKLPVWKEYRAKTNYAAAALRDVLREAKSLPPTI